MFYVIAFLIGLAVGGACMSLILSDKARKVKDQQRNADAQMRHVQDTKAAFAQKESDLTQLEARLRTQQEQFERRHVSYAELQNGNQTLKRDLQNIHVNINKLQLDCELQRQRQDHLDERSRELGSRYLKDTEKWIGASLTANNFAASKQRLLDVINRCREAGYEVSAAEESRLIAELKSDYERIVKLAVEREEQARIKAQIREEQKVQKEIERELKQLERERAAIQAALDRALAEARDAHSDEVERLRARLADAEDRERAVSQAQLTKAGYVYVISNIGSFGQGVFKVGMTRRLEPKDRIRELGDASVPFPFDVHMMISCPDAPALENALHRHLHKLRVNKTNPRKEFFKTDIESILKVVEQNDCKAEYIADPEALEYRQSLTMTEEDAEFIESVYDNSDEEEAEPVADDA